MYSVQGRCVVEMLLDTTFNACLPDFGHPHLVDHEKAELTTMMAGTIGYMAPRHAPPHGASHMESDMYSFGVVWETTAGYKVDGS
jgi:serine/threonine protein kinase